MNQMIVREPAVAGMFYAARPEQLRQELSSLLCNANAPAGSPPKALIVPHAGYIYSGPVAATAYQSIASVKQRINRVVLFGPAHRVYLQGMAVPGADEFATPLGNIPLATATLAEIAALPGVCVSDVAHRDEHSLEVQLPFLQMVLDAFELVPVVVGQCDPGLVADVLETVWGGPETLIVISSDLSHYLPYAQAQQIDAGTCRKIIAKVTNLSGEEACGAYALNGLLSTAQCRDLQVEAMDLRNSGDTSGDRDRVVGYGAFILH